MWLYWNEPSWTENKGGMGLKEKEWGKEGERQRKRKAKKKFHCVPPRKKFWLLSTSKSNWSKLSLCSYSTFKDSLDIFYIGILKIFLCFYIASYSSKRRDFKNYIDLISKLYAKIKAAKRVRREVGYSVEWQDFTGNPVIFM